MNLDALKTELVRDEGRRAIPYHDSIGKLTIGVGHNLSDKPISSRTIDVMLEDDINDALNDLFGFMPWVRTLSDVRQRVLANMCFNMGIHVLMGFKQTLDCIHDEKYEEAAQHMLDSLWAKQVGIRAERLAQMMRTDQPVT